MVWSRGSRHGFARLVHTPHLPHPKPSRRVVTRHQQVLLFDADGLAAESRVQHLFYLGYRRSKGHAKTMYSYDNDRKRLALETENRQKFWLEAKRWKLRGASSGESSSSLMEG